MNIFSIFISNLQTYTLWQVVRHEVSLSYYIVPAGKT